MKVNRKLLNRLGAVLCALVIAVSVFGVSVPYKASTSGSVTSYLQSIGLYELFVSEYGFSENSDYSYSVSLSYFRYDSSSKSVYRVSVHEYKGSPLFYTDGVTIYGNYVGGAYVYCIDLNFYDDGISSIKCYSKDTFSGSSYYTHSGYGFDNYLDAPIYFNEHDVMTKKGGSDIALASTSWAKMVFNVDIENGSFTYEDIDEPSYNSDLGYLQNISYRKLWERGKVTYYYDDSSRTDMWSFDALTTTGVDLTAGNYSIRHYIQPCLVTSYKEEDIVEEYDKYFMGEYDASALSFQYKRADYDAALKEAGFEGLGFLDSLLGRFILEHQLFQIVNNDTGEVGGYVVLRPEDADSSSFGIEYLGKTITPDGVLDLENGYDDTLIDYSSGSGSTLEEAIENSNEPHFDSLAGVESFTSSLNSFSESLGNVPLGLKSIINLCPWWVLASLGLSFVLAFVVMLYKVFR